jgi:hypothetical protein
MCLPTQLLPELSIGFFVFSDILFPVFFDVNLLFCKLYKLIFNIYVNCHHYNKAPESHLKTENI